MTMKVKGTIICELTRGFFTGLLFTTSEEDFPEYCYSGEFSISEDDIARFDDRSFSKVLEILSLIEEEAGKYLDVLRSHGKDDYGLGAEIAFVLQETGTGFDSAGCDGKMYRFPDVQTAQRLARGIIRTFRPIEIFKFNDDRIGVTVHSGKRRA